MKKIILILILMMFFFSSVAFSQGKGDENALLKIEEPKEEQIDIIMSTLETAKSGQIKIDKSSEELAEEKEKIEQQKTELITNGSGLEAEDPELKKQLKLLEKKQQFIEANEKAIEERIQATERTMALIERKIQIINNENLTLNDIRREDRKIRKALKADEKEKVFSEHINNYSVPVLLRDVKKQDINILVDKEENLKSNCILICNNSFKGYRYDKSTFYFFLGGTEEVYEFENYKININLKIKNYEEILEASEEYRLSDFIGGK